MGFLFDILIPVIIILAVAFIWLRTLLSQFLPQRRPRPGQPAPPWARNAPPAPVNPRSFSESGGMEGTRRERQTASIRQATVPDPLERLEGIENEVTLRVRPQREAPAVELEVRDASEASRRVRRALGTPGSVRTAFVIKEVLDPPVGMRN